MGLHRTFAGLLWTLAPVMLAASALAAPEGDAASGGAGLYIHSTVPTSCSVEVTRPLSGGDGSANGNPKRYSLGQLEESCNSGSGFDVYAITSPVQADGEFIVDGQAIPVSSSGFTLIDSSDRAQVKKRSLAYEVTGAPPSSLSFTIRAR
jgi:hypothetical protein